LARPVGARYGETTSNREADVVINPNFHETLHYHSRAEPASVLADLKELKRLSARARAWKPVLTVGLVAWLTVAVVACVAAGMGIVCVAGALWFVAGIILFSILTHRNNRMILPERRRRLAVTVVRALACDLPPAGVVELGLDFGDYVKDRFKTDSHKLLSGGDVSTYHQPWLEVTAALADGSLVTLGLDLMCRRKERTKSKGRKKIKEAMSEHVVLTIRAPDLSEQAGHRWPERVRAAPLPRSVSLRRAVVKKDRLCLEVRTPKQVRVTNKNSVVTGADVDDQLANEHTLLMPVLAAYQALAGCRQQT
jgi:hypothetical protein